MDATRARDLLEAERRRLLELREDGQTEELTESQLESTSELSAYGQHPGDLGTETFEREKELSILEHLDAALAEVDAALERLEAGSYGRCRDCGEPIADERLEVMPAARRCVVHQAEYERTAPRAGQLER